MFVSNTNIFYLLPVLYKINTCNYVHTFVFINVFLNLSGLHNILTSTFELLSFLICAINNIFTHLKINNNNYF